MLLRVRREKKSLGNKDERKLLREKKGRGKKDVAQLLRVRRETKG